MGNKTTNAKARAGHTGGVKGVAKDIEKSQTKPTTLQRPKQKSPEIAPINFQAKAEQEGIQEDEEPEYAPLKSRDIPYESDVLPQGLLTFKGLKKENLFKGYYEHFYNPIDDNGVAKHDREFEQAMEKVVDKAEAQNKRETDELNWNISDLADTVKPIRKRISHEKSSVVTSESRVKQIHSKHPSTIASRRAASALSIPSDVSGKPLSQTAVQAVKPRKPLSSLLQINRAVKDAATRKVSPCESAVGEAASRTTIGYKRGKSTSSMMQSNRAPSSIGLPASTIGLTNSEANLTVTPARIGQAAMKKHESEHRPQFMSIFDADEDETESLLAMNCPLQLSDDEEEFELRFEI